MEEYKKEVTCLFEKMTKSDQVILHHKITSGDRYARDKVIQNCLPLVIKIAESYHKNNKHIDLEDLIQEGNMALIRAVDKWDINKGNITTIATWYVRNALTDMINDSKYKITSPFSLTTKAAEDLRKVNKIDSTDINDISSRINMKSKRVMRLIHTKSNRVTLDKISCSDFISNQYKMENIEEENTSKKCIVDLYRLSDSHLSGIDKMVFSLYIGRNGKRMRIRDICNKLNMIEQDVRSIINRCKTKLKRVANA